MKNLKKILLSALAALVIGGAVNAYAYSDADFAEAQFLTSDGIYTVITDTQGAEHTFSGIINAKKLENYSCISKIASYKITENTNILIDVKLNDILPDNASLLGEDGRPMPNGYYSVKFTLSESDNTEVFLTGLSDSNLNTVQEKLISAKLENEQFTMESLDFIDAEKTNMPNDGDNELCWAATASNMLLYTGWGQKAGFNSEDDLLDLFRDSFTDVPGNAIYALEWFFNGIYQPQTLDNWAQATDYGNSGKYFKQYSSDSVSQYIDIRNNPKNIKYMTYALENGCAVGISLGWVDNNGNRNGGHAITAWGYICDRDFSENDTDYYKALIVSDSDSDIKADTNRRTAPNKLNVLNISPFISGTYNTFKFDTYGGVLELYVELKPYSDTLEYETDADASLDKFNNADFNVNTIFTSTDGLDNDFFLHTCSEQDSVYVVPKFENLSEKEFDGTLGYTVTVTDKSDNSEITGKSGTYNGKIQAYEYSDVSQTETLNLGSLPKGEYTITVTVNPEKSVTEAYYYNNTKTYDFSVTDISYDVSAASINANIGEFTGSTADAALEYTGLDTVLNAIYEDLADDNSDVAFCLAESYCYDGKWSPWLTADTSEELPAGNASLMSALTSPPDKCLVYKNGEKVKFRLIIQTDDDRIPLVSIYSNEYDLQYTMLSISADETNTGVYTPIERGVKELAQGEQIAFKITNTSTYDSGKEECTASVYARQDGEYVLLFNKEGISLNRGETSDVISFNSWEADLSGIYELVACAEGDFGQTESVMGNLKVEEQVSFEVTTSRDIINPYDNLISLREAVSYIKSCGGEGDAITFNPDISILYQSEPIIIDANVKINGNGCIVYGQNKTQLFNVTESGFLEADNIRLHSGKSENSGGAIENTGGTVHLKNSAVLFNNSASKGGAIYSDGGSVKLLNCAFKENTSGYGGAVCINGGAKLNMLNCSLFKNSSNGGAVYNNSGTANIIYSTFTDNTAASSGGGAVTSYGKTNVIGSIATLSGGIDIDGNVSVYGSYITDASDSVRIDASAITGGGNRVFVCGADGTPAWYVFQFTGLSTYVTEVSPITQNGIYVKNADGKIAYSNDNINWSNTEADSAFTDKEYKTDVLGIEHGRLFGSQTIVHTKPIIVQITDDTAVIYVPEEKSPILVERQQEPDGTISGIKFYNPSLDIGTNYVKINSAQDTDLTYMLWDKTNLAPLCTPYYKYSY